MTIEVIHGDVLEVLADRMDEEFTAVFCDPPYGYDFMQKDWDHGVPGVSCWSEILRMSVPGALLLAFGGTRTYHRLTCAIEDSGYQIFDCLMWLHGQGFPKSNDISKSIDKAAGAERKVVGKHLGVPGLSTIKGWNDGPWSRGEAGNITAPATPDATTWSGYGTSLKPAWEPCVVARKPREGTYAQCAVAHGSGALWIDGGRLPYVNEAVPDLAHWKKTSGGWKNTSTKGVVPNDNSKGRWPANLVINHEAATMIGEQAERFFYCTKPAAGEKDAGLDGFYWRVDESVAFGYVPVTFTEWQLLDEKKRAIGNVHPTVKPIDLCRYYAKLIRPPESYLDDAVLCVPFSGTGSEIIGAMLAGWKNIVGVDNSEHSCEIARARIENWQYAYEESGSSDVKALRKWM